MLRSHRGAIEMSDSQSTELKRTIVAGIDEIPEIGWVIGGLVDLLWDTGEPTGWDSIRERTEALIKQELDHQTLEGLHQTLKGLQAVVAQYASDMKSAD